MGTSYYLQLIFTLVLMAAILYGALRFAKTIQQKRFSGDIELVDRLPIDNGTTVMIVRVRDKEYLLSVSGKELKVIDSLS